MLNTTVGQLLVNDALPEDMRDYNRVLDKKGMKDLFREIAQKHPDKYRDVSFKLATVGRQAAQESGGYSFGLRHMRKSRAAVKIRQQIQRQLERILDRDDLDDDKRSELIIRAVGKHSKPQQKAIFEEALKEGNPLAMQVLSGSRGNEMNLASLLGSDLLYADSRDRSLPIPVLRSYSEGLSPWEYWAGAYGARKGTMATKFATQDAGFLSKQLNQVAHRLVVEDEDYDDEEQLKLLRGVPVDIDDMDNEGALLAQDVGPYKKNTVMTPKVLKHLKRLGHKRLLARSPMVGGTPAGGVYARDVGVRETGALAGRGEFVGLQAAQALSEPLSQAQLSAKHSGGVAGEEKGVSGFQAINQAIQVPKAFKGGAAHAEHDGKVQRIEPAPAGGQYVWINDEKHYVGAGFDLKVKKGDTVEAGDVISEGLPNPQKVVQHKGVGEGKRYFTQVMRQAMADAGIKAHRRNIELLARGLINHVRLTDEYEDFAPDDVIPYSTLEHRWKPREGHQVLAPKQALGQYLERPVLHYSIGTKIRPSMLKDFEDFGVKDLTVHADEPPFKSEMIRGMYSLQHDPDWVTRLYASGQKKSLLSAVHRGGVSEDRGSSFVPSLATSVNFGRDPSAVVQKPGPPRPIQQSNLPDEENKPVVPKQPSSFFGGKMKLSSDLCADLAAKNMEKRALGPDPTPPSTAKKPLSQGTKNALPTAGTRGNPYQASASTAAGGGSIPQPQMAPPSNPYAFGGSFRPSQPMPLMGTQMGAQFVQGMNQAMPGMGGVIGLGTMLDPSAMGVLTAGQRRPPTGPMYGAAGYGGYGPGGYMGGQGGWTGGRFGQMGPGTYTPPTSPQTPAEQQPQPQGNPNSPMNLLGGYWDRAYGLEPGSGVFDREGPVTLGGQMQDWGWLDKDNPGFAGLVGSFIPNPMNPSRHLFGDAQALSRVLGRPTSALLGLGRTAMSPAWRGPLKGLGHMMPEASRVGAWLRGLNWFGRTAKPGATAATKGTPWMARMGAWLGSKFPALKPLGRLAPGKFISKANQGLMAAQGAWELIRMGKDIGVDATWLATLPEHLKGVDIQDTDALIEKLKEKPEFSPLAQELARAREREQQYREMGSDVDQSIDGVVPDAVEFIGGSTQTRSVLDAERAQQAALRDGGYWSAVGEAMDTPMHKNLAQFPIVRELLNTPWSSDINAQSAAEVMGGGHFSTMTADATPGAVEKQEAWRRREEAARALATGSAPPLYDLEIGDQRSNERIGTIESSRKSDVKTHNRNVVKARRENMAAARKAMIDAWVGLDGAEPDEAFWESMAPHVQMLKTRGNPENDPALQLRQFNPLMHQDRFDIAQGTQQIGNMLSFSDDISDTLFTDYDPEKHQERLLETQAPEWIWDPRVFPVGQMYMPRQRSLENMEADFVNQVTGEQERKKMAYTPWSWIDEEQGGGIWYGLPEEMRYKFAPRRYSARGREELQAERLAAAKENRRRESWDRRPLQITLADGSTMEIPLVEGREGERGDQGLYQTTTVTDYSNPFNYGDIYQQYQQRYQQNNPLSLFTARDQQRGLLGFPGLHNRPQKREVITGTNLQFHEDSAIPIPKQFDLDWGARGKLEEAVKGLGGDFTWARDPDDPRKLKLMPAVQPNDQELTALQAIQQYMQQRDADAAEAGYDPTVLEQRWGQPLRLPQLDIGGMNEEARQALLQSTLRRGGLQVAEKSDNERDNWEGWQRTLVPTVKQPYTPAIGGFSIGPDGRVLPPAEGPTLENSGGLPGGIMIRPEVYQRMTPEMQGAYQEMLTRAGITGRGGDQAFSRRTAAVSALQRAIEREQDPMKQQELTKKLYEYMGMEEAGQQQNGFGFGAPFGMYYPMGGFSLPAATLPQGLEGVNNDLKLIDPAVWEDLPSESKRRKVYVDGPRSYRPYDDLVVPGR